MNVTGARDKLREVIQRQASLIVSTGTGGARIQDVDNKYQVDDRLLISAFRRLGSDPPFPWRSLWEWHGFYSQELPTYASRRQHVASLTRAAFDVLDKSVQGGVHDPASGESIPTWEGIDARIEALIAEYSGATDKDTWQDVGRRSREILIDLGRLVADPKLVPVGELEPKIADARAWFDLFVEYQASGRDRAELRAVMRKTWDLAQKVTHGDIDDVDSFAAAQATVLLVRTAQKLLY